MTRCSSMHRDGAMAVWIDLAAFVLLSMIENGETLE